MKLTRMSRSAGWLAVASLLGAALIGPATALATDLHQDPPITASSLTSECDGSEDILPGQVYWHFVLVDATTTGATLTATFQSAGTFTDVPSYKVNGDSTHFAIITPTDDTLLSALTSIDGRLLNLSHVCYGTTTTTTSSGTTTTTSGTTTTATTTSGTTTTTSGTTTTTSGTTTTATTTSGTTTSGTTTSGTTTTATTTTGTISSETTSSETTSAETTTKSKPNGQVKGVTGTPDITPPSTDASSISGSSTPSGGAWQLLLVAMAGLLATVLLLTPAAAARKR